MSWSSRRRLVVFLIVIVALLIVVGLPAFFAFYHAPTCFDNAQNQGEEGIDCGGPCAKLCQAGFAAPQELWATSSQVVSGVYNLLAYVSNPNAAVSAPSVSYDFKLYDSTGILVSERMGETSIPAAPNFAVFEPSVTTGNRVPYRTFFQFTSAPLWQAAATTSPFSVIDSTFETASTTSVLSAIVANSSLSEEDNVYVTAIIYATNGNALAFSKSLVPKIAALGTADISFTWPYHISGAVAKKEFLFNDNSAQ